MELFLQYQDLPLAERVPASEDWPTSMQALVREAIEDYLAHRPLKIRTGPDHARKPKPKIKRKTNIKPTKGSGEWIENQKSQE